MWFRNKIHKHNWMDIDHTIHGNWIKIVLDICEDEDCPKIWKRVSRREKEYPYSNVVEDDDIISAIDKGIALITQRKTSHYILKKKVTQQFADIETYVNKATNVNKPQNYCCNCGFAEENHL